MSLSPWPHAECHSFGPHSCELPSRLCKAIETWKDNWRHGVTPCLIQRPQSVTCSGWKSCSTETWSLSSCRVQVRPSPTLSSSISFIPLPCLLGMNTQNVGTQRLQPAVYILVRDRKSLHPCPSHRSQHIKESIEFRGGCCQP